MTESEILQAALEIQEPESRRAFLQSHSHEHPELILRVDALLQSHEAQRQTGSGLVVEQVAEFTDTRSDARNSRGNGIAVDHSSSVTTEFHPGMASVPEPRVDADDEIPLSYLSPSDKPGLLGRLAHYEVQQVLGRGAFGIVLKAIDEKLQRVVAIKVLAPEMAATSPARKRFLREARSSASVRHEHVVNIYGVEEQPLPYLVMEYIPGRTLQQRLDEVGPLDVMTVVRLGRQMAEGLAAAHIQGLIHRDIKPGNILLEESVVERVKITDFGLARATDDASMTQSGLIVGTPMYMAPEQVQGQKLDQRADLFSLGSVLYQMVSGRPPFRASSTLAVLKRVVEEQPRPIQEIIPETPAWLCDIIARLHAKKPDDRFQTAEELATLLADCEAKLKESQPVTIVLPPARQPSRMSWKRIAWPLFVPLLILGITETTGITRLWNRDRSAVAVGESAGAASNSAEAMSNLEAGDESVPGLTIARQTVVDVVPAAVPQSESPSKAGPPTFTNSIGMEFVIVPKGKSWLGGGKDRIGRLEVDLPNDFYLGRYEVTQDQWQQVMGANPSSCHEGTPDELPVETVSWDAAQEFIAKLNQREKDARWTYRLPTEVEWEYACRGGPMPDRAKSRFDFYFATPTNEILPTQANFAEGSATTPVGIYTPNPLGLYDMHGNVHEWCADPVEGPYGRVFRAHRGGCWHYSHEAGRAGTEGWFPGNGSSRHLGLRLARVPVIPLSPGSAKPRAPFTAEDVGRITALSVRQRAAAVITELKARHPGLDGTSRHTIEAAKVTEFTYRPYDGRVPVSDLSPLKALPDLRKIHLWNVSGIADLQVLKGYRLTELVLGGHDIQNPLASLESLRGMPLVNLQLYQCAIQDLEPLRGLPLELLALDRCALVRDLSPLRGMPLNNVSLGYTDIRDLEVFQGMSLKFLAVQRTGVTDLTPLKGMELEQFLFTPKSITAGLDVLRDMTSLKQIGIDYEDYTSPADFWARYDKGEFTQ